MFDLANVLRFVSFLTYLGFIVGSISGFVEVSKDFNLCELFICIIVLVTSLLAIFLQITNTINTMIMNEKNILYLSAIYMFICSLLILGLSNIAIVFGVWGILMSIGTSVYSVFLNEDVTPNSERIV
jgi:hypothetical protein